MATKFISRFAPSPTGHMHLGHAWSAIIAHDAARAENGAFLVRIEDIDEARCRPEFVDAIFEDLAWLGLDFDGDVMVQSTRGADYAGALARLDSLGILYRCRCTRADIAARAPHGEGVSTYPGTCRHANHDGSQRFATRIDMAKAVALAGPLEWHDAQAGRVVADPQSQGDVVIARKDALASYHLAVTLDDAAQGVSHVVRGRDLFAATHIHRLLQALLGLPVPTYHHHPLIVGSDGTRLAKRKASPTLASMREKGCDGRELTEMLRAGRFPVGFAVEAS
jgi:glutamyl-Q tRNA(Asp) synthetase